MGEVTWTNLSVLKLIEEYKKRPQLWDVTHESYRVLSTKYDAFQELADMFECNIGCIRKKMNSLFASHRREKAKVKYGGKSTWFLYPYMSFLPSHIEDPSNSASVIVDDTKKPQMSQTQYSSYSDSTIQYDDDNEGEVETLDTEYLQEEEEEEDNMGTPVIQEVFVKEEPQEPRPIIVPQHRFARKIALNSKHSKPRITRVINKRPSNISNNQNNANISALSNALDKRLTETIKLLRKSDTAKRKDECDSFGEYIAISLRKHDERTQCMIKQAINNILFEQEMKRYGNNQQFTVVLTNMDENPLLMETGESITGNK